MIPPFPKFKTLELSDMSAINSFTKTEKPYSDFAFSNIWSWDINNKCKLSLLNGNLIILFTDYYANRDFLSFMGHNDVEDTVSKLLDYTSQTNISATLGYVPEKSADPIKYNSNFLVYHDRDNSDYIYSIAKLSEYEGSEFKNKRQLASKFEREYPDSDVELLNLNDPKIKAEIRRIVKESKERSKNNDKPMYLDLEEISFNRLLDIHDKLDLVLTGVVVGDKIVGFSLDEILHNNTSLSHYFKVDFDFTGIYEYLNMHTAKHLLDRGVKTWNWVEDLGIENLRQSKLSYRPIEFLNKYKISLS